MENEGRLRKQLQDQVRFLRNSCRSYDGGHHEEAVRIAVALQNLIGPNRNSKSIVSQLAVYFGLGLMKLGTTARESSYGPDLTAAKGYTSLKLVTIDDWMQEIVLAAKRKFYVTREELIAVARNEDGGAHVAPLGRGDKLKGAYEALSQNAALGYFMEGRFVCFFGDNQRRFEQKKFWIRNVHYVALRQMAHEVLNSPDIAELCVRP